MAQENGPQPPARVPPPAIAPAGPGQPPSGAEPIRSRPGRLELLSPLPPGLGTPRPTPEKRREYGKYVRQTIDPEMTLDLVVGRPRILVFDRAPRRVYLAQESIAQYQIITEKELAITGVVAGSTVLNIWMSDNDAPGGQRVLSYLIRVLPDPERRLRLEQVFTALEGEINRAFPDSYVRLSLVGDQVVVRGQAKDVIQAGRILAIVSENVPRPASRQRVENLNFNISRTSFALDGDQTVGLQAQGLADDILRRATLGGNPNVINMLQIPGEQTVMLRVTVAEVNRSAARSIGLNFSINNDEGTPVFQSLVGNLAGDGGSGLANALAVLDNGQVELAINALRTLNLSRTLAEPNLTALNGRTASFSAGGQFPVPVVTGFTASGLQGVAFVPFGVQLEFTPFVVDRDKIRLRVAAEVSTRDESLGASIGGAGGTSVPGLNSRDFQTTVELREGQTLAVAGLIQRNFGASSDRVPWWGDLPFIGATGGVNRTSAGEQELVILITPELVHPLEACKTPPLPGSDIFEPTDLEFFLHNRLESRRSRDFRSPVRTDHYRLKYGEKCGEDLLIIGPSGYSYGCCGRGPSFGVIETPPGGEPIPARLAPPLPQPN